jgi:FHA domain
MRSAIAAFILVLAFPAIAQAASDDAGLLVRMQAMLSDGMDREPQLMIAAAMLGGLLPVVSLLALASRFGFLRWNRAKPEVYSEIEMAPAVTRQQVREIRGQLPLLDVIGTGADADVHRIDSNMIRIGRHEENDIRLASQTVHRYHAVLHRTPEQKFVITDLSGPGGNGVVVNAERVDQAPLAAGDLIELGDVRLRFRFGEAH